jgi:hypothetical protein
MKYKWISIKRLKEHEFHTTLRRLDRSENTWTRRFEILSQLETAAIKGFTKLAGAIFISYLVLSSLRSGDLISIKFGTFEASIPATYSLAISSYIFLFGCISFCHLSTIVSLKAKESARLILPGFSTSTYSLLKGKEDDVSLGLTVYNNRFFSEKLPISTILGNILLMGIVAVLIPLSAVGIYLLDTQIELFLSQEISNWEKISIAVGGLLIVFSFIYAILFHIPLPTKKNAYSIRWGFLILLVPRGSHPRAASWLSDQPKV